MWGAAMATRTRFVRLQRTGGDHRRTLARYSTWTMWALPKANLGPGMAAKIRFPRRRPEASTRRLIPKRAVRYYKQGNVPLYRRPVFRSSGISSQAHGRTWERP